jgi:hypothetical protein
MSGAGGGFQGDQWHGKQLLKNLIGLPIAGAIGSPQWIKKHPQSALAAAAVAATVLTAGAAAPALGAGGAAAAGGGAAAAEGAGLTAAEIAASNAAAASAGEGLLGAGGTNVMTGAAANGAAGFGEGASQGLLQAFGNMGPEQASILAQQNAGLGLGADKLTLSAANTAGGGNATLGAQTSKTADAAYKGFQNYQKTQAALDSLAPKPAPVQQRPMQQQPQGLLSQADPMPTTPYSPMDPLWVEWLKRHQQGVM